VLDKRQAAMVAVLASSANPEQAKLQHIIPASNANWPISVNSSSCRCKIKLNLKLSK
jgi:hypothetical protein